MLFTPRGSNLRDPDEALRQSLEPVIRGLGMSLIELSVFRSKPRVGTAGNVQVRAVVYREGITGLEDCSKVHRGILPRLELAFPEKEIYLEVSSPGIDRIIKDGSEFAHYIGRGVRCYRIDISDWTEGILRAADEKGIMLGAGGKETALPYEIIAKAKLAGDAQRIK
ncbi:MAG: ribosome assembly cofactor RimP [Treponema sp.]|nr:ribosome assembly cofactor RimP [Treponema sp.]